MDEDEDVPRRVLHIERRFRKELVRGDPDVDVACRGSCSNDAPADDEASQNRSACRRSNCVLNAYMLEMKSRLEVSWKVLLILLSFTGTIHGEESRELRSLDEIESIPRLVQRGDVFFSEVMTDALEDQSDWIEIRNRSEDEVDIRGLVISDGGIGTGFMLGKQGCETTIPPGAYLVVQRYEGGEDETCKFSFGLGSEERLVLRRGEQLIDSVAWNDDNIPAGNSLGRLDDAEGLFLVLGKPTPGGPNSIDGQSASALQGAEEEVLYSPFGLVGAFGKSYKEYGIGDMEGYNSNLPLVVVKTADGVSINNNDRILAHMWISSCLRRDAEGGSGIPSVVSSSMPSGHRCTPYDYPNYDGKIGISIRGRSSQRYPKKQYRFELWSADSTNMEDRDDVNHVLLGLPSDDDWILHGPYVDRSLMRNTLAYALSRSMGWWATRTQYVELYLDQNNRDHMESWQYDGVYYIGETIKRGEQRLNIESNNGEADSSYIIQLNSEYHQRLFSSRGWAGDCAAFVYGPSIIELEYPKPEESTCEQKDFVYNLIVDMDNAINNLSGFEELIDIDSWVDYFLLTELSKNQDGFTNSVYMHKEKGKPVRAGPVWDFNLAFGNFGEWFARQLDGWQFQYGETINQGILAGWYGRLVQDTAFSNKLKQRWSKLREDPLSDGKISAFINRQREVLYDGQKRNFDRWNMYSISTYHRWIPLKSTEGSFEAEVEYLERFTLGRAGWMDEHILYL